MYWILFYWYEGRSERPAASEELLFECKKIVFNCKFKIDVQKSFLELIQFDDPF